METGDTGILKELEQILKEHHEKSSFLELLLKSDLFNEPKYRYNFNLIVVTLHNRFEDIFDRILRVYTRPKQKDEDLFEDEIMNSLKINTTPEIIRKKLIFNLGFNEKKLIIYDLFRLSKNAKNVIDKLCVIRNSIVHRYNEDDKRFKYIKKNVIFSGGGMATFLMHCIVAMREVLSWETRLLHAIDKAEKELN